MITISRNRVVAYSSYTILVTQYDVAFSQYLVWNFSGLYSLVLYPVTFHFAHLIIVHIYGN